MLSCGGVRGLPSASVAPSTTALNCREAQQHWALFYRALMAESGGDLPRPRRVGA